MRTTIPIALIATIVLSGCGNKADNLKATPASSGTGPISFYTDPTPSQETWLVSHRSPRGGHWYHITTVEVPFELNGKYKVGFDRVSLSGRDAKRTVILHSTVAAASQKRPLYVAMGSCLKTNNSTPKCLQASRVGRRRSVVAEADLWVKNIKQLKPRLTNPNYFATSKPLQKVSIKQYTNYRLYLEIAVPLFAERSSGWNQLTLDYRQGTHKYQARLKQSYSVRCKAAKSKATKKRIQVCMQNF